MQKAVPKKPANKTAGAKSAVVINRPPLDNILSHFFEKSENITRPLADDVKDIIKRIYISSSWSQCQEKITNLADMLREQFRVVSRQERASRPPDTELVESICRELDNSQLFLLIFDEAYETNPICRLEFNHAQRRRKHILPIKLMAGARQISKNSDDDGNSVGGAEKGATVMTKKITKNEKTRWLPYPLDDTRWIEFKNDDAVNDLFNEITERMRIMFTPKAKLDPLRSAKSFLHSSAFRNKTFTTVNVPSFSRYFSRKNDEEALLREIREICKLQDFGCLAITGDSGVGKTSLMAHLFKETANNDSFFVRRCQINVVIWVNCWKWRDSDKFDEAAENEFTAKITRLAEQAARQMTPALNGQISSSIGYEDAFFFNLDSVSNYFKVKERRLLFVLDDFSNLDLVECLKSRFSAIPFYCVTISAGSSSEVDNEIEAFADRTFELKAPAGDERFFVDMLEMCYEMSGKLTHDQLGQLASRVCKWSPLIGAVASCHFTSDNCKPDHADELKKLVENVNNKTTNTIALLTNSAIERLEKPVRNSYYAFLLFEPGEPVFVDDLAILWGFEGDGKIKSRALCRVFEREGLILKQDSDHFFLHKRQFDAAFDCAKFVFDTGNLEKLRYKIATGRCRVGNEPSDKANILCNLVINARFRLVSKIFRTLFSTDLARLLAHKIEAQNCQTFLQFFFNKIPFENELLQSLLWLACERLGRTRFVGTLMLEDDDGKSLFVDLFRKLYAFCGRSRYVPALIGVLHPFRHDFTEANWFSGLFLASNKNTDPLIIAAVRGDLTTLESEYEKRSDFNEKTLAFAARRGHFEAVQLLAKIKKEKNSSKVPGKTTPLSFAARNGHLEIVAFLAESYPEWLDFEDEDGWSPLMHALSNNRLATARFLIENGAKLAREKLEKILFRISSNGHAEALQFLFEQDLIPLNDNDFNVFNLKEPKTGRTLMHCAVLNGQIGAAQFLHEKSSATAQTRLIEICDENESTPLAFAVQTGCLDLVKFVYEAFPGAAKMEDRDGTTPLIIASGLGYLEIVIFLAEKCPESVMQTNRFDWSPLMSAASSSYLDVVRYLYEKMPNVAIWREANEGRTPVMVAAGNSHLEIVSYLGRKCTDALKLQDIAGRTALARSAGDGQFAAVKLLLELCEEAVFIEAGQGETPLMLAARNGHVEIVSLLYQHYPGAVKLVNKNGLTSAAQAAIAGHFKVVEFLLDK